MGLCLSVLIVQNAKEEDVRSSLEKAENLYPDWNLDTDECQFVECNGGVKVLLNDMCSVYERMPKEISKNLACPVMLCYIYDGDYWGYNFYDNGKEVDIFNPEPEYFQKVSDEEKQRCSGNSRVIAQYFNVDEEQIKKYLIQWEHGIILSPERPKAYESDEFCIGVDWQMADFMRAIGYSFDW